MPTFTAIALDRLLESSVRDSSRNTFSLKKEVNDRSKDSDSKKPPKHIYISPALYTTPEPTPIPESSSTSVSPSPYVVNRKRRDFRLPDAVNRLDGFEIRQKSGEEKVLGGVRRDGDSSLLNPMGELCPSIPFVELEEVEEEQLKEESPERQLSVAIAEHAGGGFFEEGAMEGNDGSDEFFDPRDSISVSGCSETDDFRLAAVKNMPLVSQSEFYDADEEFFSDGPVSNALPSLSQNVEAELHVARLNLFEEIERRKKAEDAICQMCNQCLRVSKHLSQAGLSFPVNWDAETNIQLEMHTVEQLCLEVVVTRFVSEAIGRGQARAETEAVAEAAIELKNQEISRLRDRLQYYEAVNHEMSHRNQEVMEISRRQRHRRKTRQGLIWSFIGLSITLGASIIAYSYIPQAAKHSSVTSNDYDVSSSMPESD